ncbi:MAG: PQQ-binding-like beta-propeller repeat protein [Myxococcaceae bacterium]|nr:PQQ-binding-like beta-propeller repeat protein [Myxococcaceae bacterium]
MTLLAIALKLTLAAEVSDFTATTGNNAVTLKWTPPALVSIGVVIVRSTNTVPNTAPTNGTSPAAGTTLGNGVVRYNGTATTFTDNTVVNGTRYVYRIFNKHALNLYSEGLVPTSNGLSIRPTNQTSPNPRWCYATGLSLGQQPITDPGAGVMAAGSAGKLFSVDLTGAERFRPLAFAGAINGRLSSVPLEGRTGRFGLLGDVSGFVYFVNLATGVTVLNGNLGISLGDSIQATPGSQLNAYANAAFKAANTGRDLVYVATRNLLVNNNRVSALSSTTGLAVWTYQPGDLDMMNGGMLVDYTTNRVWVAARSNSGAQASLRVIDTLTGAEVTRASLGDIDTGVVKDFASNQAYVINSLGSAYGYDLTTGAQAWSASVGPVTSYLYPLGNSFIASRASGQVQRWAVSGNTATLTWSVAVPGPSGVTVDFNNQVLYVGSSDGTLRKIALATGTQTGSVTVSTDVVGMPTIDTTANRLTVGTLGGDLCSYALPL